MNFADSFSVLFVVLIAVGLVVSAIGFYKYVYFISLGYGFSIAAMGVTMLILFFPDWCSGGNSFLHTLAPLLLIVYGCRLGGYLLIREMKSASYRSKMKKEIKDGSSMSFATKACIWISCALLYALQVSPVFFGFLNKSPFHILYGIGVAIMLCGIAMESTADLQKSKAKKENPSRFCDKGLYQIVRCPNYFGEILFWTGVFVTGIPVYNGIWQWLSAIIGYACIVYIMFGGARRLELRQNRTYGNNPEYQQYVRKVPIILPLVPLYSVAKFKWLVG